MISNFSSFVEFFAAIYVTMAVNNDFCSNFWTPKYYQEMESLLKTYDFSGSSSIKTYCSKKGISAKDMIAWLRVNKPIKNNI